MTDQEIKKALECCVNWGSTTSCADCPLCNTGCIHFSKLKETLALINRQQAEIERLNAKLEKWLDKNNEKNIEIVKSNHKLQAVKSEAIKEFAEKLCEGRVSNDPVVIAVKCLLEELVGDAK